ncbi:MAG: hypothetical protein JXL81_09775 [Deltaproteobacteria bacterium]|nr:hypothetical protein [Deltaproteobacteria bacterium]
MDQNKVTAPPHKVGYQNSKELTIMLIGSVGKMRSFKISRRFIWYMSLFFILYIAISLIVFFLFFNLHTAHQEQTNELLNLQSELNSNIKAMEQKELYIKGLEDFYYAAQKKVEEKTDADLTLKKTPEPGRSKADIPAKKKSKEVAKKDVEEKTDTGVTRKSAPEPVSPAVNVTAETKKVTPGNEVQQKTADTNISEEKFPVSSGTSAVIPAETKDQDTSGENVKDTTDAGAIPAPPPVQISPDTDISGEEKTTAQDLLGSVESYMEIRDVKFQKNDTKLIFDFRLVNTLADDKSAEGYVHIIVMNKDKECPPEWNSAYNRLKDGFPIDYKHGQQFIIQRFRPYQRQYDIIPDSELPSYIRILVYDQSGQKILEKEFPVADEPENVTS